jgi:hypothetical protein
MGKISIFFKKTGVGERLYLFLVHPLYFKTKCNYPGYRVHDPSIGMDKIQPVSSLTPGPYPYYIIFPEKYFCLFPKPGVYSTQSHNLMDGD